MHKPIKDIFLNLSENIDWIPLVSNDEISKIKDEKVVKFLFKENKKSADLLEIMDNKTIYTLHSKFSDITNYSSLIKFYQILNEENPRILLVVSINNSENPEDIKFITCNSIESGISIIHNKYEYTYDVKVYGYLLSNNSDDLSDIKKLLDKLGIEFSIDEYRECIKYKNDKYQPNNVIAIHVTGWKNNMLHDTILTPNCKKDEVIRLLFDESSKELLCIDKY